MDVPGRRSDPVNKRLMAGNAILVRLDQFLQPLPADHQPCRGEHYFGPGAQGIGLFNVVPLPAWIGVAASLILLDLAIYLQHGLFHAVPVLRRLHRTHYAARRFAVSPAL
jgi:sterol desaturase/sphingolipid hydroxylase (fatty acid hydroxylase superfamily)